jgi:hypothetical protein
MVRDRDYWRAIENCHIIGSEQQQSLCSSWDHIKKEGEWGSMYVHRWPPMHGLEGAGECIARFRLPGIL